MAELPMLRGVAGPGVDMAEARPAFEAVACPGGAFRFGGIVAAFRCLRCEVQVEENNYYPWFSRLWFPARSKMGDLGDGGRRG
jgi:hypothetical protein